MSISPKRIAVIGSGAAGLTAAYLLDSLHQVTLFEKAGRLGGHTHTVQLPSGPDEGTPIDTGFIVFNQKNYPLLCRLFERLGVATEPSDMAFGLTCHSTGLEYCSDFPQGLFAQKRNYLRPQFLGFIYEIIRVNRLAKKALRDLDLEGQTLGDWLQKVRATEMYRQLYLLPMGAAIWSTPNAEMLSFPAEMFLRFFENHGLWDLKDRPRWRFVSGGSQSYVSKIRQNFRGKICLNSGVIRIRRETNGVWIETPASHEKYDAVVIAAHADEAFLMLDDPSEEERDALSVWHYTQNEAVLHWDEQIMPRRRGAWASWNCHLYSQDEAKNSRPVALTYWMNRLQKLKTARPYFVTLNALDRIDPQKVVQVIRYTHPHYDFSSRKSQVKLGMLNGLRNTYFCGSYFGNGFHEDAVRSAVYAAEQLGGKL